MSVANPGDLIDLTLSGMAYGGEAFGRDADGRMIFVPFTCPGELVQVRIVDSRKRWARGELIQLLQSSPERISARCVHFQQCGGCHYQHMNYPAQLEAKTNIVRDQLRRIGGIQDPPVVEIVPSPSPWNTRNHMQFSITHSGHLGLKGNNPDEVIRLNECHLPCSSIDEVWPHLELQAETNLEKVSIRSGYQDEILITLHGSEKTEPVFTVELYANVVWFGAERRVVIAGDGHILQEVNDRLFRVTAGSFFQVHKDLTTSLVNEVLAEIDPRPKMKIFDLYAGVGLFSLFLAEHGAAITAVEESPIACEDFEHNLSQYDQIELYQADVESALPTFQEIPDVILLDPPRAGLDPIVVDHLVRLKPPKMIYISCDPATFARDAKRLTAGGFNLEQVIPLDFFPQTYHIEVISNWSC